MGSSSSRMVPRQRSSRRFRLSSLLCGTSFSDDLPHQIEEKKDDEDELRDVDGEINHLMKDPSLICSSEGECSLSSFPNTVSQQSIYAIEDLAVNHASSSAECSNSGEHLPEGDVLMPCQANDDLMDGACSTTKLPQLEPSSTSGTAIPALATEEEYMNAYCPKICPDSLCSSSMSSQDNNQLPGNSSFVGSLDAGVMTAQDPMLDTVPTFSDSSATQHSLPDEPTQDAVSYRSGYIAHIGPRQRRNGSMLHVDVVSISSELFSSSSNESSSRETRRNSRRLFWDAFSRRSLRRNEEPASIFFSTEESDDLESHNRWLLDFTDTAESRADSESVFLSRRQDSNEQRRHSRSEIWERLRGSIDENRVSTNLCASGLHPEGTCSCESLLIAEGLSTRASISRIVVLAEALFEVLDEIHRQPISLSFSMVSLPAPESVVNSFPLKTHKTPTVPENGDVEQCYICLAEYEDGDKIRLLPCRHEFHMLCVDKWLKEVHGVCPLCRGDVCAGVDGTSVSDTQ